ncbi:hypothetical protein AB0K60_03595 [Thermopolyspora sp. NPDC052614]|uniref:hypothetical protein n=1 Tax=Thermopolyspora sp. NPDC052614 TaxID=3155682 RepID=UPI00341A23A7
MRWVAAATALALLACGCAAGEEETFVPGDAPAGNASAGNPSAGNASAAPRTAGGEAEGSSSSGPRVEKVSAAPGMTVVIEWPSGLAPEQQAMIKAYADYYTHVWGAIATGGRDVSYGTTVEGMATRSAYEWVRSFMERANAAKGTVRVYALRVAAVVGRGAEVDACVDRSGVRVTDAATGRATAVQPAWTKGTQAVHFQAAGVRRGDDGTWRVANLRYAEHPDERAKECVR